MKSKLFSAVLLGALVLLTGSVAFSASVEPVTVDPFLGGNAYEQRTRILDPYLSGRETACPYAYKIDDWDEGDKNGTYSDMVDKDGNPLDNAITIKNSDGKTFDWESDWPVCAVIVKGGTAANLYIYNPATRSDMGLVAPDGKEVSHVTFVFGDPDAPPECWFDETAWAAGFRYVSRGSWAMYVKYEGEAKQVTLFAGQTYEAGTVYFSAPDSGEVTITIALNSGFRFDPDKLENVKIQDYTTEPIGIGNPAIGSFTWKRTATGTLFTISVPVNAFYGVHADVERSAACLD